MASCTCNNVSCSNSGTGHWGSCSCSGCSGCTSQSAVGGGNNCWCGRDCGGDCSSCSADGGCSGSCSGSCSGGCSGSCSGSCSGCTGTCNGLCNNGCSGNADANAYNRLKDKKLVDYITNEDWDDLASILTQCYKCKLLAADSQYPNNLWPVSEYDFITASFIKTLINKLKEVNTSSTINSDSNGNIYNIIPLSFAQQMLDDTVKAYNIVHGNK